MQAIRSFIAMPIPPALTKAAGQLVERLACPGDGIKWVPTENLHLTLKFLGDVDNRDIPRVCEVARQCCEEIPPFNLEFCGAGAFPAIDRPRIVHVGVSEGGESLKQIVDGLETKLADLGFKPDQRDYIPHLTLGRVRGGSRKGSSELSERIAANDKYRLGGMVVDRVLIMASFLDKKGPTYQVMNTIML